MEIATPSTEEVSKYLSRWDLLDNYVYQESSLKKLFSKTYPLNIDLDDILIKVCSLNDFYSTNIFSPFVVAKHILSLNIDGALHNNDLGIVNKIAKVKMNGGKIINFYSFATKYCSHHKPTVYPIYDSYLEKVLMYFKKKDHFSNFYKSDLKVYVNYHNVLLDFRKHYGLEMFDLKQIDRYLWQLGKEHFLPKKLRKFNETAAS